MPKKWSEKHFKLFGLVLLLLAGVNGWAAYAIFPVHPVLASLNLVMAVLMALSVVLSWQAGGSS